VPGTDEVCRTFQASQKRLADNLRRLDASNNPRALPLVKSGMVEMIRTIGRLNELLDQLPDQPRQ
jgi:hypothetical protein